MCVCGGVLEICVLVFTVFCILCTVFLYSFGYVYYSCFVCTSVKDYCHRVKTQLQYSNNNNNNNNNDSLRAGRSRVRFPLRVRHVSLFPKCPLLWATGPEV